MSVPTVDVIPTRLITIKMSHGAQLRPFWNNAIHEGSNTAFRQFVAAFRKYPIRPATPDAAFCEMLQETSTLEPIHIENIRKLFLFMAESHLSDLARFVIRIILIDITRPDFNAANFFQNIIGIENTRLIIEKFTSAGYSVPAQGLANLIGYTQDLTC
jgi:hypothetical protein